MLTRMPSIFLCTYSSLNTLPIPLSTSSTSSKFPNTSTRPRPCGRERRRTYATIAGDSGSGHDDAHTWPKPLKGQRDPTPYQIFAMKTNATYSKARYYELVKIYHPDRAGPQSHTLSASVKLERYRLIVAAHTILSDPAKRSAYDRFGAGWNGKADVPGRSANGHPAGPFSRSWQDPSDPIWQNATWEDWQRYYEWRAHRQGRPRPRQAPVYFRNSYFIVMVGILAMVGSTMNSKRAHDAGTYFIHKRDLVHDRTAKELRNVKHEATTSASRQDRIDWFLRNREATMGLAGSDGETLRQEKIDRLLPDRDTCNSGDVADKGG